MDKTLIQQEIVSNLPNPCHGILDIAARVGKSKIALDIVKKENSQSVLWVTPNAELRDKAIPAEIQKWSPELSDKIKIICWASLEDHIGTYDKVIMDEIQDLTISNSRGFFSEAIGYNTILGLTATMPKHREKLDLYDRLGLKVLKRIGIDTAIDLGLIAPYNITVIECELESKIRNIRIPGFIKTELEQYNYLTSRINDLVEANRTVPKWMIFNRMRFIYNLPSKNNWAAGLISKLKGRTLVFSGSIEQAEKLSGYTYHSKTTDSHLNGFLNGELPLLSCVNAGGTGFTYTGVDNFVIVQVNSNKKGDITQKICRSLMKQQNYTANIYILAVKNTVDEVWKNRVLQDFNSNRVVHKSFKEFL